MTYLAQILGNAFVGLVSIQSLSRVGQMDNTLRAQQVRKKFK